MKLIIVVVQWTDADPMMQALMDAGYSVTQISSAGGYLKEQNVTLMIGVCPDDIPKIKEIVQEFGHSRKKFVNPLMPLMGINGANEVQVGGATMFILPIHQFERLGYASDAHLLKEQSVGN